MAAPLPRELTHGATLRDKEYAWELSTFPVAVERAPSLGYACLGGQFWFLLSDSSLYEPFWLEANSSDTLAGEARSAYAQRSCVEVLLGFNTLVRDTDFNKEARGFRSLESVADIDLSPMIHLMFNAYFVTEAELSSPNLGGETGDKHRVWVMMPVLPANLP
jgi:hypothetical protein